VYLIEDSDSTAAFIAIIEALRVGLSKVTSDTNLLAKFVMLIFNTTVSELILAVRVVSWLNLAVDSISI